MFKESALQLATFDGHKLSDIVLCNIIVAALNKNSNYQNLSISLDGRDAGTLKIEELCNSIIRFWSDTHINWGFNLTAEELNSGKKKAESLRQLRKQVNSMQADMSKSRVKPNGANANMFAWPKRKFSAGGRGGFAGGRGGGAGGAGGGDKLFDSKKAKSACVFCGKPGHPARDCRKKPDVIACFKCSREGHKANVCTNDVPDASANAAAAVPKKTAADSKPKQSGERCTKCHRYGHSSAECWTRPCPQCDSLSAHDWNKCDGTANEFSLSQNAETVEGGKHEGENPQLTYVSILKRPKKPLAKKVVKFVSIGVMNRFLALSVAEDAPPSVIFSAEANDGPISPKQSNDGEIVSSALNADDRDWWETLSDLEDPDA